LKDKVRNVSFKRDDLDIADAGGFQSKTIYLAYSKNRPIITITAQ